MEKYHSLVTFRLEEIPNLEAFPDFGEREKATIGTLHISDCGAMDFSSLAGLTGQLTIEISNTTISDLTPFSEMVGLGALSLQHCGITDTTPLPELQKLCALILTDNSIADISTPDMFPDNVEIIY
jgi:hypothetical protein